MADDDPWRDEPPGVAERRMEPFYMEHFMERPEPVQIQCSTRSIGDRCVNPAIAYVFNVQTSNYRDAVPALCGPCCLTTIEQARPGEDIAFHRLEKR